MANDIEVDDAELQRRLSEIMGKRLQNGVSQAVHDIASEILRLGMNIVPHDKGQLAGSAKVIDNADGSATVGYNKVYAARLHENPQFRFQKGRMGKWMELTIVKNLGAFKTYYQKSVGELFSK